MKFKPSKDSYDERVPRDLMDRFGAFVGEITDRKVQRLVILVIDEEGHPGMLGLCWDDCHGEASTPHNMDPDLVLEIMGTYIVMHTLNSDV